MRMAETIALQNARALKRLEKALPEVFPAPVLTHALAPPLTTPPRRGRAVAPSGRLPRGPPPPPPRPRAARPGPPAGWAWRLASGRAKDLPATFRAPAAPYREKKYHLGPGFCCVC